MMARCAPSSRVGCNKRQRIAPIGNEHRDRVPAQYGFAYCALLQGGELGFEPGQVLGQRGVVGGLPL
jgi:hypothetical protein